MGAVWAFWKWLMGRFCTGCQHTMESELPQCRCTQRTTTSSLQVFPYDETYLPFEYVSVMILFQLSRWKLDSSGLDSKPLRQRVSYPTTESALWPVSSPPGSPGLSAGSELWEGQQQLLHPKALQSTQPEPNRLPAQERTFRPIHRLQREVVSLVSHTMFFVFLYFCFIVFFFRTVCASWSECVCFQQSG